MKPLTMNFWLKANPRHSSRGAPMGQFSDAIEPGTKVHIEKLDWVDGDYDRSATYWGRTPGEHMYAIWCDDPIEGRLCIYYRAKNRREAVMHAVVDLELRPLRGNLTGDLT
ncbi:MAG: hypothetical protein RL260_1716 [Pseudomonadota bacterium]